MRWLTLPAHELWSKMWNSGGKCVVMVTNALQHLPAFDWVYVLRNGRVVESGSFARLITAEVAAECRDVDRRYHTFASLLPSGFRQN